VIKSDTIATPSRPGRRVLWWSALLGGPILLLGLAWFGLEWYQEREYRAAIAEADRLDAGWRLADLEAARAEVPDQENAAIQVLAARRLIPPGWFPSVASTKPFFEEDLDRPLPNELLDADLSQRVRKELSKASTAIAAARKVADMPRGRYAVRYSPDAIGTLVDHIQYAREIATLLQLDAFQRIQEGDIDGSLISCRAIINSGRSIGDEPIAISQIVRLTCRRFAVRSLERALAQGSASESALTKVQELLENEAEQPLLLIAARAERGAVHQFLEVVEAKQLDRVGYGLRSRTGSNQVDDLLDRGKARSAHAPYLRYLNECVEIAKLPAEEQVGRLHHFDKQPPDNVPQLLEALSRSNDGNDFKKLATRFHYGLAFLRCAIIAVSVELYRLANQRWPDKLDDLTPQYLSKVPLDPFDGQPLRYRRLKDGVIIYSVGEDGKDEGGERVRIRAGEPDRNVGFQLWDAERRRQPQSNKE
jgi:hypothetical protein